MPDTKNCFAFGQQGRRFECAITTNKACPKECALFVTPEQMGQARESANARLRSLPQEHQLAIAQKYYGGKMPWKEDASEKRRAN